MALAGGGSFRTLEPTGHTLTHIDVLRLFLDVDVRLGRESQNVWRVDVRKRV